MAGKKNWYFPDAELPPKGIDEELFGHESIILLNPNENCAHVYFTLYWTDREPKKSEVITVDAKRVLCLRVVEDVGLAGIPVHVGEQYAIALESDRPIIAQYGRLDVRQSNMAFYATPGYAE